MSTRIAASRPTILLAAIAAIALSMLYLINPVSAANFTPGQDGHPTTGESSDLKGGTATFTFQQNAQLTCDGDTASSFDFNVDYSVTGTLPVGAVLIIYLSPNQGAINNNAGADAQGYIDDVQSNFFPKDVGGLTGSGSFAVHVPVGTSFELSGGGVLGVFAQTSADVDVSNSKTNSVQCSEAQSVAESQAESVAESVPASEAESVAESVPASEAESASAEQTVEAGTGTPEESQADSSLFFNGSGPLATIAFSLILLASLGTLAYANVKSVRSRNQ